MNLSADTQLRRDALAIWLAAVDAVDSARLVRENVRLGVEGKLVIAGESFELGSIRRIVVVGAGKAGAGMAAGLEEALGSELLQTKQVTGWLNVPADCVRKLQCIQLHAARPAGVNEPTAAGAAGSAEIMRLVGGLGENDLCIALISGGGSALLPLPIDGISLDDKLAVTRFLSAAGAPIEELNTVRKQLSRIKGGGLARACQAGRLVTLIISDVLGDPLDLIASGPTVDDPSTPQEAVAILDRYGARESGISPRVFDALKARTAEQVALPTTRVTNHIIGNNAVAVAAAVAAAERLGYQTRSVSAQASEGAAEHVGRELAAAAIEMRNAGGKRCFVSGGEPTVKLIESAQRGRGGRNQQLVLAAVKRWEDERIDPAGMVILSGGTDGEDGPTDAAGAVADAALIAEANRRGLSPMEYLDRNDAYNFFEPLGGLIKTGPTHTNVCDVRVVVTEAES